ncbi:MAG: RHS repeat-associated core domain-containing protein [Deltaproteobacteria bacterium]|nr:RHS repeat-associated core domain-containing protein [Deltaproteobacteria bacterium]
MSVAFGYDGDGLLTSAGDESLVHAGSSGLLTSAAVGEVDVAWTYDALGAVATAVTRYDGDEVASFAYELDELGRIVTVTETVDGDARVTAYEYDEAGRLSSVDVDAANVASYEYDGNGNRIEITTVVGGTPTVASASIDAQDRLVVQGDVEFEYAVTGELLSRSEDVLGLVAVTQYEHDAFGQLVAVELPDATLVEYELDARGRRVSRSVDGVLQQQWLYRSQLQVVAELDGAGDVVSRFVYGSHGHVPDLVLRDGSTYRLVVDHVGSVRLVVDVATGAIAQRLDYAGPGGPWGEVLLDTNPGFQPFGFAGGLYDAATGLVHFGAREYDPSIGRWISKDPVGFDGGTNHFAYCEGDPVNLVDPDGESPIGAAAAACAASAWCASLVATGASLLYAQAVCFASGACKLPPFPRFDFDLRLPESCRPIADKLRDRVSRVSPYREPAERPERECWVNSDIPSWEAWDSERQKIIEYRSYKCNDGYTYAGLCP